MLPNIAGGVGEAAVQAIIDERDSNGQYKSIFDIVRRVNLRSVNKKTFESMAYAGGFDSFEGMHRANFFAPEKDYPTFLEKIVKYGYSYQESETSSQHSLFGESSGVEMPEPVIQKLEEWPSLVRLKFEKEVIGFYISGHPLDLYRIELRKMQRIKDLSEVDKNKNREITIGAMVTAVNHRMSKNGKPFASFTIEDYDDSYELYLFGEDYLKFKMWLNIGEFIFIKGKLQDRYKQPGNVEFKISSIQLLADMREKMMKNLTLKLPVDKLSTTWINNLISAVNLSNHDKPGTCILKFKIYDPANPQLNIDLPSKKYRVNPENELLDQLEKMAELEY